MITSAVNMLNPYGEGLGKQKQPPIWESQARGCCSLCARGDLNPHVREDTGT